MSLPTLDTARLRLLPIGLPDAAFIQAEFPHWEIVRFMNASVPWPYPDDGALVFLRDVLLPQIARGEGYAWTMRLRDAAATPVGVINLRSETDEHRGFWVARAYQGQGYAREAADAVTDFWFDQLGHDELRVAKAAGNAASRGVSIRQGMRVVETGERDYVGGRYPTEVWAIRCAEWRAYRSS
jgi:ribosomal-protein-alanine N-acetyltransferase